MAYRSSHDYQQMATEWLRNMGIDTVTPDALRFLLQAVIADAREELFAQLCRERDARYKAAREEKGDLSHRALMIEANVLDRVIAKLYGAVPIPAESTP